MANYRLAKSLDTLRNQVNAEYPNRSILSDGTIGDAFHSAVPSDHNPNTAGVVTALDLTHDPKHGFDAHKLADILIKYRHPNLKYVVSNSRIAYPATGWKWILYAGSNPHDKHIHISVGVGEDGQSKPPYDSTAKWNITGGSMPSNAVQIAETRLKALGSIARKVGWVGNPDATPEILSRVDKFINVANTRERSLTTISKALGHEGNIDDVNAIVAKIEALKGSQEFEPVSEQLFKKKG